MQNGVNRAAVAMICGVVAWVVCVLHGVFVGENVILKYTDEACKVILFLIATNTILEIMAGNGVFDSLTKWLRMRNSKHFLWAISLLTFIISANVDNLTTVVLMMSIMGQIVSSHFQKRIYACAILVSALLGGSFTVIGDMTSLMLWAHEAVTPSAFAAGLILPVLATLLVFNLLMSTLLHGRVEALSIINRYDGDESTWNPFQKIFMLIIGIGGLWSIPSFHSITNLPPYLGALTLLGLVWVIEGIYNFKRNGNRLFIQRKYIRNTEFIGMRLILYFLGITLLVGALTESGCLTVVSQWLNTNIHNVYIYGAFFGIISTLVDNIPFVMLGLNLFDVDTVNQMSIFAENGTYWQILAYCSAMGGSLLYVGTLAGYAVVEVEKIRLSWYFRHISWRVLIAWVAGMAIFVLTH